MKHSLLILALALVSSTGFARTLTVACAKQGVPNVAAGDIADFSVEMEIANIRVVPTLTSVTYDGVEVVNPRLSSSSVESAQGRIEFNLAFGRSVYNANTADVSVSSCTDSFSAGGEATIEIYVGGFAG